MEVIYKNKAYKSKCKPPKGPGSGHRKLPHPRTPDDMDGDRVGISEQPMDPKFTEVSEEERPGTSASVSDLDEGCTLDDGKVHKGVSSDEFHTTTLNGIVLEYLELMGLDESYNTFLKECTTKSIPVPHSLRDPLFRRTNFTEKDCTAFFAHFDVLNGEGLSELWTKFLDEVDETEKAKLGQVTFFLRIFIASLPFRKNEGEEVKAKALEKLRESIQVNSEEFTKHPLCLPLFGFPFVGNPMEHEAFKTIFTPEWQNDLQKQLESLFGSHLDSHATYGVSTCDLKRMYNHYAIEIPEASVTSGGEAIQGDGGTAATVDPKIPQVSPPVVKIRPEFCAHIKRALDFTQERYCKLLASTAAVVNALEQAVQGKAPAIRALETKLQVTFPEIFDPNVSSKLSGVEVPVPKPRIHVAKPEVEQVQPQTQAQEVMAPEVTKPEAELRPSQPEVEEVAAPDAGSEAESEQEESESEFSDQDTEPEGESEEGGDEEEQETQGKSHTSSAAASKMSTARAKANPLLSARSSILLDSPEHDCDRVAKRHHSVSPGRQTRRSAAGDSVSSLKLTDSKVSTRVVENPEEWAENGRDEVPEKFCQYFPGLSPRKGTEESPVNAHARSLLPPSVTDPFPSPPRTYQVSPRSSRLLYIPSSMEVGCSSGPPTFESRSSSNSDEPGRRQDDQEGSSESARSTSSVQTGRKSIQLRRCLTRGGRPNPDVQLTVAQHLLPRPSVQETLLLGNRVLTPPPYKKTTMASIMGVLNMSNPGSPASSSSRSTSKEQQPPPRGQSVNKPGGPSKPLRGSVSETGKVSMKITRSAAAQVTVPAILRKSGISKVYGTKKKYSSVDGGQGYAGRIYKIDNQQQQHKVLGVKPIGARSITPD